MGKKISKTDGANLAEIIAELSEKVMQQDGAITDIRKNVSEMKKHGGMAGVRNVPEADSSAKIAEEFNRLNDEIEGIQGEVAKKADKSEIEKLRTELLGKIQEMSNQYEQKSERHEQKNDRNEQNEPKGKQSESSKNPKSLLKEIWELIKDTVILILRIIWLLLKFLWAILCAIYKCICVIYNWLTNEKFRTWIYNHGTFLLSIIFFSALAWFMWYSYGNIFK